MSKKFWGDPALKIYLSHFLSSWGDRLWQFFVGVYLYDDSLLLTAIYGFSSAISIILFGALIGRWIDNSKRITAAKVSILIQNLAVLLCAVILIIFIRFRDEIQSSGLFGGFSEEIVLFFIILLAVLADLASVAVKISLEKDWIVVLAKGDECRLAKMNTIMRSINLASYIIAPIVAGQLITYWSSTGGAIFVAGWNIFSAICEIYLLDWIYKNFPRLAQKSPTSSESSDNTIITTSSSGLNSNQVPNQVPNQSMSSSGSSSNSDEFETKSSSGIFGKFKESLEGWRDYKNNSIRNAGLALAMLYMTVLGFDNITYGYLLGEGLSASLISTFIAFSAIFGILGTCSFPFLRNYCGLLKTGILGFGFFTCALIPCVISIWVRGSPFDLSAIGKSSSWLGLGMDSNKSKNSTDTGIEFGSIGELLNGNFDSELLFISGMIISRFGLWVSDLSVTQIFQEKIPENQRGIINGVQDSLNQLMNLLKFLLVILLPRKETFGYLVMLSWLFILMGLILFTSYAIKTSRKSSKGNLPAVLNGFSTKKPDLDQFCNVNLGFDRIFEELQRFPIVDQITYL